MTMIHRLGEEPGADVDYSHGGEMQSEEYEALRLLAFLRYCDAEHIKRIEPERLRAQAMWSAYRAVVLGDTEGDE